MYVQYNIGRKGRGEICTGGKEMGCTINIVVVPRAAWLCGGGWHWEILRVQKRREEKIEAGRVLVALRICDNARPPPNHQNEM